MYIILLSHKLDKAAVVMMITEMCHTPFKVVVIN